MCIPQNIVQLLASSPRLRKIKLEALAKNRWTLQCRRRHLTDVALIVRFCDDRHFAWLKLVLPEPIESVIDRSSVPLPGPMEAGEGGPNWPRILEEAGLVFSWIQASLETTP